MYDVCICMHACLHTKCMTQSLHKGTHITQTHWGPCRVLHLLHYVLCPIIHSLVDPDCTAWLSVQHKPVHTSRGFATQTKNTCNDLDTWQSDRGPSICNIVTISTLGIDNYTEWKDAPYTIRGPYCAIKGFLWGYNNVEGFAVHTTTSHPSKGYLPDSNLKAMLLEPYWRMWSICHLTTSRGNSSSVNIAMWNKFLSKSLRISNKQGPLKGRVLAFRSRTRKVSSSGITTQEKCSNIND